MHPPTSRRDFLLGTGALALAGLTGKSRKVFAQPDSYRDYWQLVRAQFSFTEQAVPMNAANLCPSFRGVAERVAMLTADIDRDCSSNNRAKFSALLEESRNRVARQLNVSADEVALVRNTSEANNIINNGLDLEPNDEVIVWDQNHPTNNVAWDVRAARYGLRVTKVATPANPDTQQQLVDAFVAHFSNRTRVLAITHVSNVSGIKLPVRDITAAAHARGIYVHLDGAQTWGAMAVDLQDLNVDSYSASAHKWYMGPKEVGLLVVREHNIERLWPSVVAPGWGTTAETILTGARKFESLGQRDDSALAALGVAAETHDLIGSKKIEQRIVVLSQSLKQQIVNAGNTLITPMDADLSFGVCITRAPQGQAGVVVNALYENYGIAGAATGGIRLCPHIYNTEQHVERAATGVNSLIG
jgi:isopenicillin-N epimerase